MGKETNSGWSVGSTGDKDRVEGRLQLLFCFSTRDKSKGLDLLRKQNNVKIFGLRMKSNLIWFSLF